jgi:hypothetical protein
MPVLPSGRFANVIELILIDSSEAIGATA